MTSDFEIWCDGSSSRDVARISASAETRLTLSLIVCRYSCLASEKPTLNAQQDLFIGDLSP